MKKVLIACLVLVFAASAAFAQVGFRGRPITNNVWMPTGYTLNGGEFIIGIGSIGFGLTNNIQLGTNILLFLFQDYNASLKISLIKSHSFALAGGVGFHHFSWNLGGGGDINPTAITPYAVVSLGLGPRSHLHAGGEFYVWTEDLDLDDIEAESSVTGTRIYGGLEHGMSDRTKFLIEGGYDLDFKGMTIGGAILFGWKTFRLKLGVSYYAPEAADTGFTLPVIGLWWRFAG